MLNMKTYSVGKCYPYKCDSYKMKPISFATIHLSPVSENDKVVKNIAMIKDPTYESIVY